MTNVIVSVDGFIAHFPELATAQNIQIYLTRAQCYIPTLNYGALTDDCRVLAIYLVTAHLLALQTKLAAGKGGSVGAVSQATIDKVNVSMTVPTSNDEFSFWLNQTQYGLQLLSLLESRITTPLYIGGSNTRVLR